MIKPIDDEMSSNRWDKDCSTHLSTNKHIWTEMDITFDQHEVDDYFYYESRYNAISIANMLQTQISFKYFKLYFSFFSYISSIATKSTYIRPMLFSMNLLTLHIF